LLSAQLKNSESYSQDLRDTITWIQAHPEQVPDFVCRIIASYIEIWAYVASLKQKSSRLLEQLRIQMGIIPKSERGDGSTPTEKPTLSDKEKLKKLTQSQKRITAQIRDYKERLGLANPKNVKRQGETPAIQTPNSEPAFASTEESLFSGNLAEDSQVDSSMRIDRQDVFDNPKGLHSSMDKRYEYKVTTTEITLNVETVTDPRTGKSVTASTDEVGPPNSQATWKAIANTIMSVIGYAIPINRLALMLEPTCPYFTSSRLCSLLDYAAELFLPIYTFLGEALSDAEWLMGDDTKTRVIEIQNKLTDPEKLHEHLPPDSRKGFLASVFGRIFPKKRGLGFKKQLNVSVVIGKLEAGDPRSFVYLGPTWEHSVIY
jgi:hypothetical protein